MIISTNFELFSTIATCFFYLLKIAILQKQDKTYNTLASYTFLKLRFQAFGGPSGRPLGGFARFARKTTAEACQLPDIILFMGKI